MLILVTILVTMLLCSNIAFKFGQKKKSDSKQMVERFLKLLRNIYIARMMVGIAGAVP